MAGLLLVYYVFKIKIIRKKVTKTKQTRFLERLLSTVISPPLHTVPSLSSLIAKLACFWVNDVFLFHF